MPYPSTLRSSPSLAALTVAGCFTFAAALSALAGDAGKAPVEVAAEKTLLDRIWELPTIYKDKDAAFLNEFRFVGRAHLDQYMIDADNAKNWDQDWVVRRLRLGVKARFFQRLDLHVETDLAPQNPRPLYTRLTEANLAWTFSEAARLVVGKQGVKFTLDGSTTSNELYTLERNNLSNNLWFPTRYFTGVSLGGTWRNWQYQAGYFSGGSELREFGDFDAGYFGVLNLGYDFAKQLGVKKALLRADYVFNDRENAESETRPFDHVGALVFQLDHTRWGLSAEIVGGVGTETQSDVWGATVMPWYYLTKNLQAVVRYNYIESSDPRGVRLARYSSVVSSQKGDEYHEIYGGLNYYIYGHKLKVQTGLSYLTLNDSSTRNGEYHAWQWTTGLRLSF